MAFDPDALHRRDPDLLRALLPIVERFNRRYLRLRVEGLDHLRAEPALYVGNHNGGIFGPDLTCTVATLLRALGPDAPLYALAHDFAMRQFRPLGALIQRFGAVRACPRNAERVLASGGSVLVYPGGDIEAYRHFRHRNRIILGTRTGFVRVARSTGAPIVPIVAFGAHRSEIVISEGRLLAKLLGLRHWARLERFPIALALPWGIAVGPWTPALPLPFPIRLRILEPIAVPRRASLARVRERIRRRMQEALDDMAGS